MSGRIIDKDKQILQAIFLTAKKNAKDIVRLAEAVSSITEQVGINEKHIKILSENMEKTLNIIDEIIGKDIKPTTLN